jgi:uncharacterized protein (DUF433 family)
MAQRANALLERITTNPGILSGKPIIRGTRMPIWVIIELIEFGDSNAAIIEEFPFLTEDDIEAVRLFMQTNPGSSETRQLS